jgi:hypothetical protein
VRTLAQIDTRHEERDELFNLFVAKHCPEIIGLQIANKMAIMEEDDIRIVKQRFEEWLEDWKKNK